MGRTSMFDWFFLLIKKCSKDDNNNPVDTTTNTAIGKSTNHGDDINPGIDPESEIQNESQMSESNNKITETESERSEHRKYGQISEKLWPWLYLNENKMFCKKCVWKLARKIQWQLVAQLSKPKNACKEWPIEILRKGPWTHFSKNLSLPLWEHLHSRRNF